MSDSRPFNIASYLSHMAATVPDQAAVVVPGTGSFGRELVTHGRGRPCHIGGRACHVGGQPFHIGGGASKTQGRSEDGDPRAAGATYVSLSFAALEALSNRMAGGLRDAGFRRGMRVLLMVRPGLAFTGLVFALFKSGIVPVMIDPGMGVRRLLECVRGVALHGFIGIPLAHVMRVLRRRSFRTVERVVTVGRRWCWGGPTLNGLVQEAGDEFEPAATTADETAAILFTSGSTGPAKGVVYEHGMFDAQVRLIQSHYGMAAGEVDLPTFPLFALFSTAMGMTCVIPEMDPSRPARVNPVRIVVAIRDHGVTNTFGSPALWARVADYCVERGVALPSLRRILIAGAPVSYRVIEKLHAVLNDDADIHTPYGATESLPVSSISGREVLGECRGKSRRGAGMCVGRPLGEIECRIIRITEEPIAQWSDDLVVPEGQVGEIVVSGPPVTKAYFNHPDATVAAKILDGDRVWHRIGDVGYFDGQGRLWFCGRKAHRVVTEHGTMFSVPCEAIFNEHPEVARSALVGVGPPGRQRPVIVVEPVVARRRVNSGLTMTGHEGGATAYGAGEGRGTLGGGRSARAEARGSLAFSARVVPARRDGGWRLLRGLQPARARRLRQELLDMARGSELTRSIETVLFHWRLPVDVRHNAKINREALARWAAEMLR